MKKIEKLYGLVIADPNEISSLKEILPFKKEEHFGFDFYLGKIEDKNIVLVFSKIGLSLAAAATQALIILYPNINLIFNVGAVGGDSNKHQIYDIVIPKKVYYGGVETPWYEYGQIPMQDKFFSNEEVCKKLNLVAKKNLISSLIFIDTTQKLENVNRSINASIFDMEAAAICNIAAINKKQCLVIKCVSDLIGVSNIDRKNINTLISNATNKAFDTFREILKSL